MVLVAPPQISEEEMKQLEAEAAFTVQRSIAAAVLLYLCMKISPKPSLASFCNIDVVATAS